MKVTSLELARAIISYVEEQHSMRESHSTTLLEESNAVRSIEGGDTVPLPHHWTLRFRPAADYGNNSLLGNEWKVFERQYASPVSELMERIYHEVQAPPVDEWNQFRNNNKGADKQRLFEQVLTRLAKRGILTTPDLTSKSNQQNLERKIVGVRVGNKVVNIPGNYERFEHCLALNRSEGHMHHISGDHPRRYEHIHPTLWMVANTPNHADMQDTRTRIKHHDGRKPKLQNITYVFGEFNMDAQKSTPRRIGEVHAEVVSVDSEFGNTPLGEALIKYNSENVDSVKNIRGSDCIEDHPQIIKRIEEMRGDKGQWDYVNPLLYCKR